MARYFYAFRWAYGIGATWDDGSWPGELYVFESRAERDAWVADDVFDGNWHYEAKGYPVELVPWGRGYMVRVHR